MLFDGCNSIHVYMEVLAPERSGAVAGAQTLLGSSHSRASGAQPERWAHITAQHWTVRLRGARLVAAGLENRDKARAAARRWTTFYASDFEGDAARFGEM